MTLCDGRQYVRHDDKLFIYGVKGKGRDGFGKAGR